MKRNIKIPPGHGKAYFTGPNSVRREAILSEAISLYPSDLEEQRKHVCATFWSEVQLDRVEMAQDGSMHQ